MGAHDKEDKHTRNMFENVAPEIIKSSRNKEIELMWFLKNQPLVNIVHQNIRIKNTTLISE